VVLGPHTFNFQDIASAALSAGVARSSATMAEGLQTALRWAQSPQQWLMATESCADFIKAHQGASQALALALGVYVSNA
jgi:3-deoxy-D-manno-octulosonic-acid transferase